MGCKKWESNAPCRPSTFHRRILSLQLMVLSLSPCWIPSQVGTMALDSTGMVPSPGGFNNTYAKIKTMTHLLLCCLQISPTVLHFGAKLALLGVLKQRLVPLAFVPRLTAGLIEQSPIPTRRRAMDKVTEGETEDIDTAKLTGLWFKPRETLIQTLNIDVQYLTNEQNERKMRMWRGDKQRQ